MNMPEGFGRPGGGRQTLSLRQSPIGILRNQNFGQRVAFQDPPEMGVRNS